MSDMPIGATTPAATSGEQAPLDGAPNPLALLRERLISFTSMTRPQRIITAIGAGALLLMALLLVTNTLPQPSVAAGIDTDSGAQLFVADTVFIVATLTLIAVMIFALAGAFASPWYLRLPTGFGLVALLAVEPIIELKTPVTGPAASAPPVIAALIANILQVVTLLVLCFFTIRGVRDRRPSADARLSWPTGAFRVALILALVYYGLSLVEWLVLAPFTHAPVFKFFTGAIAEQLFILPLTLTIAAYWAMSGLTEWGDLAASGLAAITSKAPRGLWLANAVVALAVLVYAGYRGAFTHWPALVGALLFLLIGLGGYALARSRGVWPVDVPVVGVIVGAALLMVALEIVIAIVSIASPASAVDRNLYITEVVVGIIITLAGLVALARGRLIGRASPTGLLVLLVGAIFTLIQLSNMVYVIGAAPQPIPFITLPALLAIAGLFAVGVTLAFARQPGSARGAIWLSATLSLTIGLLGVVALVYLILPALASLGALSAVLTALLFLLSAGWDLATSGADVTNGGSQRFTRSARLLLYLAYTMAAALIFTFTGAQHLANGHPPVQYLTNDSTLLPGLYALGIPVVVLTAILRIGHGWRAGVR